MLKVEMQYVENYADYPSENYWKFKGGSVVGIFQSDDRPANAIAALMEKDNARHRKMVPMNWEVLEKTSSKEDYKCDNYWMYIEGNLVEVSKMVTDLLIGAKV